MRKIKARLPFGKQHTVLEAKRNEIYGYFSRSPELKEKFPDIYTQYKRRISEIELDEMRNTLTDYEKRESVRRWYLERFEKDAQLQQLYPQEYLQLQKEPFLEEWRVLKPVIDKHMKREGRKEKLLERFDADEILRNKYGDIYAQLPNVVSDEELDRYEAILQDYEVRKAERDRWIGHLESFPKLKGKYVREYELLHQDLSEEEMEAVAVILSYEIVLLNSLNWQYDSYVKETTEANYATGKVEKLYIGYIWHEKLLHEYPEETEELIQYYGPEFDEFFFDKNGSPKYANVGALYDAKSGLRFQDMAFFREFVERNHLFGQYVITDKEYTVISHRVETYVPRGAIRGIAGTYTGYSISYENFLKVKELYPEEVASFALPENGDEDIMQFIHKMHPYLTQRKIQYMV